MNRGFFTLYRVAFRILLVLLLGSMPALQALAITLNCDHRTVSLNTSDQGEWLVRTVNESTLKSDWMVAKVPGNLYHTLKPFLPEAVTSTMEYIYHLLFSSRQEQQKLFTHEIILKTSFFYPEKCGYSQSVVIGRITDRDLFSLNGIQVHATGQINHPHPQAYDRIRFYELPSSVLRTGWNHIEIRIQNYFAREYGILSGKAAVGPTKVLLSHYYITEFAKILLLVLYFAVAIYSFFLFIKKSQNIHYLYFALFAFTLILYQFLRNQLKFELPLSFYYLKKLEFLSLVFLFPVFAEFLREFFQVQRQRILMVVHSLFFVVFLLFLFSDSVRFWNFTVYYFLQYAFHFYVGYSLWILFRAIRQGQKQAYYILAGSLLFLVSFILDLLSLNFILNLQGIANYGFFIFVLTLIYSIIDRIAQMESEHERLIDSLAQKIKETNVLYQIATLFSQKDVTLESILQSSVNIIPDGFPNWFHPRAQIEFQNESFTSENFSSSGKKLERVLYVNQKKVGVIRIFIDQPSGTLITDFISADLVNTLALILGQIITSMRTYEDLAIANMVFNHAIEGVMVTSRDGIIEYVNPAFTDITSFTKEEAIGQNPRFLKSEHHEKSFYEKMWQELLSKGTWQGEIWNRKKSGEPFPELLSITSVRNFDQEIIKFIGIFFDITDIKRHESLVQHQAFHDALTDLPNRLLFMDRLQNALNHSKRDANALFVVMFIDLDNFKNINDTLGHSVGDQLLVKAAKALQESTRAQDTVARIGGDEFILLLDQLQDRKEAVVIARRILTKLSETAKIMKYELRVSASIGMAFYPDHGTDEDSLIQSADLALYKAKDLGKNRYAVFSDNLKEKASQRLFIQNKLEKSIQNGDLELYYQPLWCLVKKKILGVEALARWQNSEIGSISPSVFISIAEDSDLIIHFGHWAMRKAIVEAKKWYQSGYDLFVSINVSPRQFTHYSFLPVLTDILDETKYPREKLVLEITETVMMKSIKQAQEVMEQIRQLRILMALDDFGTGHSSLNYLSRLPISKLKIDKNFVKDLITNKDNQSIVNATISLAHNLNMKVIAEGVETMEQYDYLEKAGCDQIQGYIISQAVHCNALPGLLEKKILG